MSQVLKGMAWKLHRAMVEGQGIDVGIGEHLVAETGFSAGELAKTIPEIWQQYQSDIAIVGDVNGVRCYIWKRGESIDIGARKDFDELGWTGICVELDKRYLLNGK